MFPIFQATQTPEATEAQMEQTKSSGGVSRSKVKIIYFGYLKFWETAVGSFQTYFFQRKTFSSN